MKALVWDDGMGEECETVDIPADLRRRRRGTGATSSSTSCRQLRRRTSLEKYVGEEEITADDLRTGPARTPPSPADVVPVLCGSAFKNKGVQPLLDAVVDYLPSPLDVPPTAGIDVKGIEELERQADDGEPFAALAFKIMSDPYVGKLTYFRVYSGTLDDGQPGPQRDQGQQGAGRPHPADARQPPRGQGRRLRRRHRRRRRPQEHDHRRHALRPGAPDRARALEFPEPVIHVAVEPKTKADQDKLGKALGALSEEDPTFQVHTDEETGQTIIGGMGELHLEVLVDRMLREFSVDANVGKPQVAYRETITQAGREGRGALRPPDRRPGPVRPRRHQPRAHRPRRRLRVRRQDHRRRHPQGVHPLGRRRHPGGAAGRACSPATRSSTSGSPSPTARTTTSTPRRWRSRSPARWRSRRRPAGAKPGAARADHGRRGRHARGLHGRRHRRPVVPPGPGRGHGAAGHAARSIRAQVPLAEMFGYATDLRSRTQGRATYTMQFDSYQQVPESIAEEIVARVRGE